MGVSVFSELNHKEDLQLTATGTVQAHYFGGVEPGVFCTAGVFDNSAGTTEAQIYLNDPTGSEDPLRIPAGEKKEISGFMIQSFGYKRTSGSEALTGFWMG